MMGANLRLLGNNEAIEVDVSIFAFQHGLREIIGREGLHCIHREDSAILGEPRYRSYREMLTLAQVRDGPYAIWKCNRAGTICRSDP